MDAIRGHDDSHRLSDISDYFASQWILCAGQQRRDADHNRNRRRVLPNIAKAKSVDHAWCGAHRAQVDFANSSVGVRAAQYGRVQNTRKAQIINKTCLATQETGVFETPDPRPHHPCPHFQRSQKRSAFATACMMFKGAGRIGPSTSLKRGERRRPKLP